MIDVIRWVWTPNRKEG